MTIGPGDTQEAVNARRTVWLAEKPMLKWKDDMSKTDSLPRSLEDLITDKFAGDAGTSLQERYDKKIKIRGERP